MMVNKYGSYLGVFTGKSICDIDDRLNRLERKLDFLWWSYILWGTVSIIYIYFKEIISG